MTSDLRPCSTCGQLKGWVGRPDPCVAAQLPGVSWLCCGHGEAPFRVVFGVIPDGRRLHREATFPEVQHDVIGDVSLVGSLAERWVDSVLRRL